MTELDDIQRLLIAHDVVEELMQKNTRSSYNQQFTVVINAINAEFVNIMKNKQITNK